MGNFASKWNAVLYLNYLPFPPHFSSKSLCRLWIFRWAVMWLHCTITCVHDRGKGTEERQSQMSLELIWGLFSVFSPHLRGTAAHADVAVVLHKALMICKSITTPFGLRASTKYYWGGNPNWRNVHINYFYLNQEVAVRQRKSHEYVHNVSTQKGYRQGEEGFALCLGQTGSFGEIVQPTMWFIYLSSFIPQPGHGACLLLETWSAGSSLDDS